MCECDAFDVCLGIGLTRYVTGSNTCQQCLWNVWRITLLTRFDSNSATYSNVLPEFFTRFLSFLLYVFNRVQYFVLIIIFLLFFRASTCRYYGYCHWWRQLPFENTPRFCRNWMTCYFWICFLVSFPPSLYCVLIHVIAILCPHTRRCIIST